ncbi:MAG: hypothetical protein R6V02_02145 [Candidatus Aminicenantes bacterium]
MTMWIEIGVLFTFNPFWRDTNHGVYAFVFNALLHAGSQGWTSGESSDTQ